MRRLSLAITGAGLLAMSSSSAFAQCVLVPSNVNGSNSASASSVVGGAQLGYNWQRGAFMYGLETDISAMDLKSEINTTSTANSCGVPVSAVTANTNANVNWYGTFRGRIGWSSGPILFYGTGGLAYGRVELNSVLNGSTIGGSTASLNDQTSSVKAGWVAGAGIEYALRPNVFLNLGYQYVDLGTISLADTTRTGPIILTQSASAHAQFSVVTLGISWRFAPIDTSPQGPWEGAYFGGHIGGAWGNSTNNAYSLQPIFPSDIRLKRDIALVARLDDGLGLYRYRYLWSDTVYVGVMAQEVALDHPDAVVRDPFGYLLVDYSKLGIKLMTLSEWNARS